MYVYYIRTVIRLYKKDYKTNEYIKKCWEGIDYILSNSYMITIFGYSAPSSDVEAVGLLKKAWGEKENRQLEEVSVIDIIDEKEMLDKLEAEKQSLVAREAQLKLKETKLNYHFHHHLNNK